MLSRRRARAATGGLVVCPALILSVAGCTGSRMSPTASSPATERMTAPGTPTAGVCARSEETAINRFFADWNHRDAAALGRLFTADGILDMATKHQDTLHDHEWTSSGGLGARRLIAAFAVRQWRLGETLSYRGGGTHSIARFADGTVQQMAETKFVYDCAAHAFAHVVIISAAVAAPA